MLWIRIRTDPLSLWSAGSGSALGVRIWIQEGQKITHKSEENLNIEVQNVHVRDEDFSCSLDILYGDLGISKLQFEEKKYEFFQL